MRTDPSRLVAAQRHRHLFDRIEVGDVPYLRSGTRSAEMKTHRRIASAVSQCTDRHVVTGHRQRTRSRDLDIIEPSQSGGIAVLKLQLYLLLICGTRTAHACRTGHTEGVVIGDGCDKNTLGGPAVEGRFEIRLGRGIGSHIHIDLGLLGSNRVRGRESEVLTLVCAELLAVERTSAAGDTCTVDQVDRVFVLYLIQHIRVHVCRRTAYSCTFRRRQH